MFFAGASYTQAITRVDLTKTAAQADGAMNGALLKRLTGRKRLSLSHWRQDHAYDEQEQPVFRQADVTLKEAKQLQAMDISFCCQALT